MIWIKKIDGFYANHLIYSLPCEKDHLQKIRKILLKYHKINFYLTYDLNNNKNMFSNSFNSNWKIHTEDEIKNNIPTGVDIEKICLSNEIILLLCENSNNKSLEKIINEKPLSSADYGCLLVYEKPVDGTIEYIEQLVHFHNNLKFIHPTLFKCAVYFNVQFIFILDF